MSTFIKKQEPNLESLLETHKQNILYNYHYHRIGIIETFDPTKQTATISLVDKRVIQFENSEEVRDYALLVNCPILINRTKNGGLTIPITQGEFCIVLFNDRDIDNWFNTGAVQKPNTNRCHNINDGIAIVGLHSMANPISNYDNNATTINYGETIISIQADGLIKIQNTSANKNLLDILKTLINIIKTLQMQDPQSGAPLSFTNADTLDSSIADLELLLK